MKVSVLTLSSTDFKPITWTCWSLMQQGRFGERGNCLMLSSLTVRGGMGRGGVREGERGREEGKREGREGGQGGERGRGRRGRRE